MIISNNWKLHYYYEDNETELYNLDIDPGESNNLKQSEKYITQNYYTNLKNGLNQIKLMFHSKTINIMMMYTKKKK